MLWLAWIPASAGVNTGMHMQVHMRMHLQGPQSLAHCVDIFTYNIAVKR